MTISNGAIPLTADVLRRLQLQDGDQVILDPQIGRRLIITPVPELIRAPSVFSADQHAAWLLNCATSEADYAAACDVVRARLQQEPDDIPHTRWP